MLAALLLAVPQTPPPPVAVPSGTLVVHLVDPDGGLVLEDFEIHVSPLWPVALGERGPLTTAQLDPADGIATFEHLSAGRYVVEAAHRSGDRAAPVEVDLRAHARLSCELRLATPPPSRCLYVVAGGPEGSRGLQLVARGASGEAIPFALAKDATNRYVARGVPHGRYTVSVDDPRYRPTSIEGVLPGEVARLTLTGSASLALRCRAVPGGEPLRPLALEVALATSTRPAWRASEDPMLAELDGLEPGEFLALAHFAERAPLLFRVADLWHGERRELELEIPLGACLSGRVVDAEGEPVVDVLVSTHTTLELDAGARWRVWVEPGRAYMPRPDELGKRRIARTDSSGRYTLVGLASGAYVIKAYGTPFTHRSVSVDIGAELDAHFAPDIALGGSASADVAVLLPAGVRPTEVQLVLQMGAGSWLKQAAPEPLSTGDDRIQMQLRGLPDESCTLVLSRRFVSSTGAEEHVPLARVTFVPKRGAPTQVTLDARE